MLTTLRTQSITSPLLLLLLDFAPGNPPPAGKNTTYDDDNDEDYADSDIDDDAADTDEKLCLDCGSWHTPTSAPARPNATPGGESNPRELSRYNSFLLVTSSVLFRSTVDTCRFCGVFDTQPLSRNIMVHFY